METGQRKDSAGNDRPAHCISNVTVSHNGKPVLSAEWGPAIAKNPYLQFKFKGGKKGDKVTRHLGRQQGRHAHRRSDDHVVADSADTKSGRAGIRQRQGGSKQVIKANILAAPALVLSFAPVQAQNSTTDEIARYRELLQDGNPAELVVARGEALWKEKRGPKKVSLEQCDLGLGPGVVKGAYAQMPRYFADADQVMDSKAGLVQCMVTLQGLDHATVPRLRIRAPASGRPTSKRWPPTVSSSRAACR